jgi:prefoldin subunit 5
MKNTTKERERIMGELKNLDKNIEMLTADFDEFEADFIATKNAFDEKINEATSFVNARVKQLEKTAQENPGQEKQVLRSDKSDTK